MDPKSGLNGVKPPVEFGQRTRDCSLGHAGKEGPHLAMTGASRGSQGAGSKRTKNELPLNHSILETESMT